MYEKINVAMEMEYGELRWVLRGEFKQTQNFEYQ